jgi:hypothetical protein
MMTEQHNPLAALIAKWRAAAESINTSPGWYGCDEGGVYEELADELEAELLKMCDVARAACEQLYDSNECAVHSNHTWDSETLPGKFNSAAYLAAEALEFAADELEAEMAKMCDGANAPCKPSNRFPDRCKQHGRITEESIERGGHFNET